MMETLHCHNEVALGLSSGVVPEGGCKLIKVLNTKELVDWVLLKDDHFLDKCVTPAR